MYNLFLYITAKFIDVDICVNTISDLYIKSFVEYSIILYLNNFFNFFE